MTCVNGVHRNNFLYSRDEQGEFESILVLAIRSRSTDSHLKMLAYASDLLIAIFQTVTSKCDINLLNN